VWPRRFPLMGPCHGCVSQIAPATTRMHPTTSIKATMMAFQAVNTSLSRRLTDMRSQAGAAGSLLRSLRATRCGRGRRRRLGFSLKPHSDAASATAAKEN